MSDLREPIATPFETTFRAGETGLVGTVAYRVDDNDGNTVLGPTTAGITELGTTGIYAAAPTSPATEGEWTVIWSRDGSFDPDTVATDTLTTFDPGTASITQPDIVPLSTDGISSHGPCQMWTTVEAVAECCDAAGSDTDEFEPSLVAASQVLYALSAFRYSGTCTRSVRPCGAPCGAPVTWATLGYVWGGDQWRDALDRSRGCGCSALSVVPLAGFAREILEVTIDGAIVDPATYRLDERRRLVRLNDPDTGDRLYWPGCQDLAADTSEDGTFEVTYTYGLDPPAAGQLAAAELACAIFQTCGSAGVSSSDEECPLPNGVVKVDRQGITIELAAFTSFGFDFEKKVWKTGLPLSDMFLNTYNPRGRRKRRTTVWSADLDRYPRPVGDPLAS